MLQIVSWHYLPLLAYARTNSYEYDQNLIVNSVLHRLCPDY